MGIQCGIVGLPNVGKSTLFNALTQAGIQAENYPFCTIEPNVGVVPVPDPRLQALAKIVNPEKILPTTIEFLDIAGLVAGASKGEGLGNQFLANIRETHAIIHVVRCFEDQDVIHVHDKIDPVSDLETIETELLLADLETTEKALSKVQKKTKTGEKSAQQAHAFLTALKKHLDLGKPARTFTFDQITDDEKTLLKQLHLLTQKPILYIANIAENGLENNPYLEAVEHYAKNQQAQVLPICAAIESELVELEPDEAQVFLEELGQTEPGLNRLIQAAYTLLGLQTYFTAGPKEVRAWTIKIGDNAPQAAGVIHTDFEKGFIRAEVVHFKDFIAYNGEQGAKEAGKWHLEGKTYVVQEGDVIHFRFNV